MSTIIVAGGDYQAVERIFLEIESGLADGLIAELQHLTAEDVEALTRRLATRKPHDHLPSHRETEPIFRVPAGCDGGDPRSASDSLYGDGHRRIAYMQHAALGERTRVNAYLAFLGAAGLPFDETLMVDGAQSRRSAHEAVLNLLTVSERPTALIAESDFAAITALNTFKPRG